jgi:secreted trypsin-like serine protease
MPPKRRTEKTAPRREHEGAAQDPPEIQEAIRRAEAAAGSNHAAFMSMLPKTQEAALPRDALRLADVEPPVISFHMEKDPRYLKNMRALARQTGGGLRVIGGTEVKEGDFLDCVAVGSDNQWACTGTLIGPKVVVSAGHCSQFATRVFFGNNVGNNGLVVRVKKSVVHPEWHKKKTNDLIILILDQAVAIPPRKIAPAGLIDGAADGRVVGFGHSDLAGRTGYGVKRQVDVPIASPACKGSASGHDDATSYGCDVGLELVAGRPLLARDGCRGDSGGPFYVLDANHNWLLAGATSRATKSSMNTCGDGGIYVRLDKYLTWIKSIPGVKI